MKKLPLATALYDVLFVLVVIRATDLLTCT